MNNQIDPKVFSTFCPLTVCENKNYELSKTNSFLLKSCLIYFFGTPFVSTILLLKKKNDTVEQTKKMKNIIETLTSSMRISVVSVKTIIKPQYILRINCMFKRAYIAYIIVRGPRDIEKPKK